MAEEKTLSDVVERLDKLVDVLSEIATALKAAPRAPVWTGSTATAAPAAPKKAAKPKLPPGAQQAALAAAARARMSGQEPPPGAAAPLAAPPVSAASAPESARWETYEPEQEEIAWPLPPPEQPYEAALMVMFQAAMVEDQEQSFKWLEALMHPDAILGPHSLDHLRAFTFRKLRKSHRRFLQADDPSSFKIVRTVPREVPKDAVKVKVFLDQFRAGTSPAPVYLARDPEQAHAWRITQISI